MLQKEFGDIKRSDGIAKHRREVYIGFRMDGPQASYRPVEQLLFIRLKIFYWGFTKLKGRRVEYIILDWTQRKSPKGERHAPRSWS